MIQGLKIIGSCTIMSVLILLGAVGCQKEEGFERDSSELTTEKPAVETKIPEAVSIEKGKARSGDVHYKANLISAVDFIKRRGDVPLEEDLNQLRKEHVLILEIKDSQSKTGIYDSKRLQISKENLNTYMMSRAIQDLVIIQADEKHVAHSVQFDKDIGSTARGRTLRAFFFFNDLESNTAFETQYFDRIFGAGLINL